MFCDFWNCNFSSDNTYPNLYENIKPYKAYNAYMFLYALYGSKNLSLKNLHYPIFQVKYFYLPDARSK